MWMIPPHPVFSQNVYNVSMRNEPSETIPIAVLSAKDSDSGDNSKIFYKFKYFLKFKWNDWRDFLD